MSDYIWEKSQEEKIKDEQPTKISQLENDVGFITNNDLPTTYPPSAHKHTKNDITDFPTSLPAAGGTADKAKALVGNDTRSVEQIPEDYMSSGDYYVGRVGMIPEFKYISTLGLGGLLNGTYCFLITCVPWSDKSGGYPFQVAMGSGGICWRVGVSTTTWGEWTKLS